MDTKMNKYPEDASENTKAVLVISYKSCCTLLIISPSSKCTILLFTLLSLKSLKRTKVL